MKVLIIALAAFLLMKGKLQAMNQKSYTQTDLNNIYKKYAGRTGLDWKLIRAVAQVESSENVYAVNPKDPSYGLMQVLFPNNLPSVSGWPPESEQELFDPDYNVNIGSQILAWNINTYGFQRGIATYNNWQAHNSGEFGPFPNEDYLHRVLTAYARLSEVNIGTPDDIY